jgi:glycosyltransferase involved in cell wall biosynthesis
VLQYSARFLVVPSTSYETFGLAAAEVFLCCVPVIASRHEGVTKLVSDRVNELLFNTGDANDMVKNT